MNHPDNLNNPNDNLMREIDRFQHEIRENGDDGLLISQNGIFSAADDQPEFNQIYRNVANAILDDDSEIVAWETDYNFNIFHQQNIVDEKLVTDLKTKHNDISSLR
jgi:trans-aconitate methyltransferase